MATIELPEEALEPIEMEILTRTTVEIPSEKWEAFDLWMNEPPKVVPELKELTNMKPIWEWAKQAEILVTDKRYLNC